MQVEWKIKGIYKADANKVASEIGTDRVTPEKVLEIARNKDSELHKCFEWDDGIAAEKYRLTQARGILLNLYYVPQKKDSEPVRKFSLTNEKKVYQDTVSFLVQEDEYQGLLKRARAEMESFKKKYHTLTELQQVFEAMELV